MRFLLLLGLILCSSFSIQAQENWRKHEKLAEDFQRKAQYAEAAEHFRFAWVLKPGNRDLIAKAANNYSLIKDYENSAEAYRALVGRKKYPMAGFNYALALKQSGKYEDASRSFASFKENYKGKDATHWARRSEMEILGCELALRLPKYSENPDAIIRHPGMTVNSPQTDFGPIPVTEDILYFSSTRSGRAQIYRAEESNGKWSNASLPGNFPVIEDDHYCNGSLTPDSQRFYFTICKASSGKGTRCEIYVTQRISNAWAPPIRLDDYINAPAATTTHPHVVHNGDTEILYFATNRSGGEGGMDIWFATRNVNGSDTDFTMPVNLGPEVNSKRDEITPFYTLENATLFFSSNGHPSIGGYDIFQSTGSHVQWERPENLGYPYNSSADDFYYVLKTSRSGGYMVSNREIGDKKTTIHDDIIVFDFPNSNQNDLRLFGDVFDNTSGEVVRNITVSLYEQDGPGLKSLVDAYFFPEGNYELNLERNARYVLEFNSPGYSPFSQIVRPSNYNMQDELTIPVQLELAPPTIEVPKPEVRETAPVGPSIERPTEVIEERPKETVEETPPSNPEPFEEAPEETPYTTRGQSPADSYELITAAPRHSGTYYKVQLIAVVRYSEEHKRYQPVKELGRLDTEFIIDRELYRVLLADYGSLDEAKEILKKVKKRGFEGAYIVEYQDGQRMGRI